MGALEKRHFALNIKYRNLIFSYDSHLGCNAFKEPDDKQNGLKIILNADTEMPMHNTGIVFGHK